MKEINIKLWRHSKEQDWSAEVHGRLHEHISTKTVDKLVGVCASSPHSKLC